MYTTVSCSPKRLCQVTCSQGWHRQPTNAPERSASIALLQRTYSCSEHLAAVTAWLSRLKAVSKKSRRSAPNHNRAKPKPNQTKPNRPLDQLDQSTNNTCRGTSIETILTMTYAITPSDHTSAFWSTAVLFDTTSGAEYAAV